MVLLAAASAPRAQQPVFKAGVSTVPVYATVVDSDGRLVTGLTADDFEIYDNGVRQPITLFDSGERPITIVVMLDRSISMQPHFALLADAARAFVDTLRPDDRVRIGSFADEIRIQPEDFSSDPDELRRIIDRRLVRAGATPLWAAIDAGLDALAPEGGQRVLVVFTDGRDSPGLGHHVPFPDILARVSAEEPIVYGIGLDYVCQDARTTVDGVPVLAQHRGPGPLWGPRAPQFPRPGRPPSIPGGGAPRPMPVPTPPSRPWRRFGDGCRSTGPDPDLRRLVEVGGGGYFELESTADLTAAFERISHEIHNQYLIGYTPPALDGTLHALEVRVRRADLTVRARRSYLAAAD